MNVTHPFVVARFVDPSLDAIALNRQQRDLVFNPSEEADSIIEHLLHVRPDSRAERDHLRAAAKLSLQFAELNDGEFSHLRTIAGTADRLARDLHVAERNGLGASVRAKAIANRIRDALKVIYAKDPSERTARDYLEAVWALGDLFREVPADQLFTPALEHELGKGRMRQLRELYEQRMGVRA